MNDFNNNNEEDDYEKAGSRATRARTRLIVEGFANLALIAILFCGVQAQLISVTNQDNDNNLSVATNAVFFGGLIFSVFTAMLATLSGRWFSILREDDADYLSSRWLAQDCAEVGKAPELQKYLEFQIEELVDQKRKEIEKARKKQRDSIITTTSTNARHEKVIPATPAAAETITGQSPTAVGQGEPFNPITYDIDRIIKLLQEEQEKIDVNNKRLGRTTGREKLVSWTLISPLAVCCAAFSLFCAGILLLTWNKQPRSVAIFTSVTVLCCTLILVGFFLRHRHKHVIKNLHLSRPAL